MQEESNGRIAGLFAGACVTRPRKINRMLSACTSARSFLGHSKRGRVAGGKGVVLKPAASAGDEFGMRSGGTDYSEELIIRGIARWRKGMTL